MRAGPIGALEVTARGQGQFPLIVTADARIPARVARSHAVGALVAPQVIASSVATRLAADVLYDRTVDDVAVDVATDWKRMHAAQ